jgi:hypothetical protein
MRSIIVDFPDVVVDAALVTEDPEPARVTATVRAAASGKGNIGMPAVLRIASTERCSSPHLARERRVAGCVAIRLHRLSNLSRIGHALRSQDGHG